MGAGSRGARGAELAVGKRMARRAANAGRDRGQRLPIDLPLGLLHPGAPLHSVVSPVRIFTPPPLESARSLYLRLGKIYSFFRE